MANTSDVLLSKLESVSWMYSIECQIHGKETTVLIKFIVEDDCYAVMVTDMTQTYFECLEGRDIDDHYRRFNRSEVKRERLMTHLRAVLSDVTKADDWHFETLLVDCHTSRLTLKVRNQMSILKFEWSFYMITTNPETLSKHLTLPLLRLVSTLRHGIDILKNEKKSNDKKSEENNSQTDTPSDDSLITKMLTFQKQLLSGSKDNSSVSHLVSDRMIASVLRNSLNSEQPSVRLISNSNKSPKNNSNVKQTLDKTLPQKVCHKSIDFKNNLLIIFLLFRTQHQLKRTLLLKV